MHLSELTKQTHEIRNHLLSQECRENTLTKDYVDEQQKADKGDLLKHDEDEAVVAVLHSSA